MNATEIINLLWNTGHFHNPDPRYTTAVKSHELPHLKLGDDVVVRAIASYQDFFDAQLSELGHSILGRSTTADGHIGPATMELFKAERCGCPDFTLLGSGSWPANCHSDWPNQHTFTLQFNKSGMPNYLDNVVEDAFDLCRRAYADMGIVFIREDKNDNAQTYVTWTRGAGWIGLAIVGNNQRCNSRIWAKFDNSYKPSDLVNQWAHLFTHEFGHNMGLSHSRGGVMNPTLINSKFSLTQWRGDPSEPILQRWFGGVPINLDPTPVPVPPPNPVPIPPPNPVPIPPPNPVPLPPLPPFTDGPLDPIDPKPIPPIDPKPVPPISPIDPKPVPAPPAPPRSIWQRFLDVIADILKQVK